MRKDYCKTCRVRNECEQPCPLVRAELHKVVHGQRQHNPKSPGTYKKRKKRLKEIPISRLPKNTRIRLEHELYGIGYNDEDNQYQHRKLIIDNEI